MALNRKRCKFEGCGGFAWKGGFCQAHGERKSSSLNKSSLKKRTGLKRAPTSKKQHSFDRDKMREMFLEVWSEMELPRRCYETGVILSSEPNTMMFHHMLPKRNYPEYALEKWNIVVLHPDVHAKLEFNLESCPKVAALTKTLLEKYGNA